MMGPPEQQISLGQEAKGIQARLGLVAHSKE